MKTTISFTLDSERDIDILDWFRNLPNGEKSNRIRNILRSHIDPRATTDDITLLDIFREIQDLKRYGIVLQDNAYEGSDFNDEEPPDIADTLNNLGL